MADAEKYAKIFRAAADGIGNAVQVDRFRIDPWSVRERYDTRYQFTGTADALPTDADVRTFLADRLSEIAWAQYAAFDGVASMFEQIVEAEGTP